MTTLYPAPKLSIRTNSLALWIAFVVGLFAILSCPSDAHVLIFDPPARGALTLETPLTFRTVNKNAPSYFHAYYPSGLTPDESGHYGNNGRQNQIEALEGNAYQPFDPESPDYRWPLGVCGDYKFGNQSRLRGGQYYFNATIVESYVEGSTIDIGLSMLAHHQGFMEFRMCDVSKCGGEVSESCFRVPGACRLLERSENALCESGGSTRCLPIDKQHPERWYLPCSLKNKYVTENVEQMKQENLDSSRLLETFNSGAIQYKLPEGFHCEHCVLHFFWVTGNSCTAPGVRTYFTGSEKSGLLPSFDNQCAYFPSKTLCGSKIHRYPEQYFSCSDIRIVKRNSPEIPLPTKTPLPTSSPNVNGTLWHFKYFPRSYRRQVV